MVDLHDLLQVVGTVTVESMNARALLYLLFWIHLLLLHSWISPFWISYANYLVVLREFRAASLHTPRSFLLRYNMVLCGTK